MRSTLRRPAAGLCAAVLSAAALSPTPVTAQEAAEDWDIEVSRAPSTVPLRFTATEGTWMSLAVSPDGRRLAFDLLGHIYEMPVEGGAARALTSGRSWNMFPRYSPDGARLAFTSDRSGSEDLWVLHLGTDSVENVSSSGDPVVQATWSADGRALYGTTFDEHGRTKGLRYNFYGDRQELVSGGTFQPLSHFEEHRGRGRLFFEHLDPPPGAGAVFQRGARIKTYDLDTAEEDIYIARPGGAFNPSISPDGRHLVYGHRDDQETVLVLHDLETRAERVIARGLDRDHQEYGPYYYGVQANTAWHPDGRTVYYGADGGINAVDIETGAARRIPFEAPVDRALDETIRVPVDVPRGTATTLSQRWPHRTAAGIVFEALGDLHLLADGRRRALTDSPAHETSPVVDAAAGTVYFAGWSDEALGAVYSMPLAGGPPTRLTDRPAQYGSLTLSGDGRSLAYVRGTGTLMNEALLEEQTDFELVVRDAGGEERVVTELSGTGNFSSRSPLTILFGPDGEHLFYTEFLSDTLTLRRIRLDGAEKTTLYRFPHAVRAVPSPDLRWIAFREYHRNYITPFEFVGQVVSVSGHDGTGTTRRIAEGEDGPYLAWSSATTVSWVRDGALREKTVPSVLDGGGSEATPLAFEYPVAAPASTIALTGVRVLTMDADRAVLEDATVVIEGDRIAAVGTDVAVPAGARVYDLDGHTVMPGIVDAHGHYGSMISQTHVIEQRVSGLLAPLAYGVTTLVELYGTAEKDFWLMDMLRSGRMAGPRLYTVGSPLYGLRFFRPKLYRHVDSYEDALDHVRFNQDAGATVLKDYVNFHRGDRHRYAAAAREQGINIVAETAGSAPMNFTQIVDGLTGLEHSMGLTPLYQDVVELFRASAIGVTPTLLVVYNGPAGQSYFNQSERVWEDPKLLRFLRRDQLLGFRRSTHYWPEDLYAPEMASAMKTLFDAGVLINLGGHGQMPGLDAHWEMELFVQGGFSPLDAIQVATINGARYHGLGAELGSIETGKRADLVILGENPLDDIRNSRSIVNVVRNGVVYDGADAARLYPDPDPARPLYFQPDAGPGS